VPKVEENGNINGCYLMLNRMASVFGVFKLSDNEELLQKAHPEIFYKLKP
jgi:hypothetical protein